MAKSQQKRFENVTIKQTNDFNCQANVADSDLEEYRKCKNSAWLVIIRSDNKVISSFCRIHARSEWINEAYKNGEL